MRAVTVIGALTVGNFFWQLITARKWDIALERSFFQGVAIYIYLLGS